MNHTREDLLLLAVKKLGEAELKIAFLEAEVDRLSELPQLRDDAVWMALAAHACNCCDGAQKQIEVLVFPEDHDKACEYRLVAKSILEAV